MALLQVNSRKLFLSDQNSPMSPDRQQFIERLTKVVTDLGYPVRGRQSQLAKRYGIKQPSVGKWFNGESMPSYEVCKDLCARAMVHYEWFITGRGPRDLAADEIPTPQVAAAMDLLKSMQPHQVNQAVKILAAFAEPDCPGQSTNGAR